MAHRWLMVLLLMITGSAGAAPADPKGKPAEAKTLPRWRQPADPEPLLTRDYLELTIALEKGAMKVLAVEKRSFPAPRVIQPRFRGRFEVRLLSPSGQPRDVIRFDLPLTAAGQPPGRPDDDELGRKLSLGVSARVRVRVPLDSTTASAVIHDRMTRRSLRVDLGKHRPPSPQPSLKLSPPVLAPASAKKHDPRKRPATRSR